MRPRDPQLARLLRVRPDPRQAITRLAVVFTGIMGLCVAGLLAYALSILM